MKISESMSGMGIRSKLWAVGVLILCFFLTQGCTYVKYPLNKPPAQYNPGSGYIAQNMKKPGNSDKLLVILSFSGGGTRAAAFSYGVLEELNATEITYDGQKRRLVDEVDLISGVSGGSFTAAYYGLFGNRIFTDFEPRFLKKNIQSSLTARIILNPSNWLRLASPYFDRSDLAAEYYDENVFEGGTFGDMLKRKGPMVFINATDMSLGTRLTFQQTLFNAICSDLSSYSVARACAASSAVPGILTPITLKNYSGICGYKVPPEYEKHPPSYRQKEMRENLTILLDSKEKPYFHLIDGGVADNLGLRAVEEAVDAMGNFWTAMKILRSENVRKVVFIVVNAETKIESKWDKLEIVPPLMAIVSNYSSIAIIRYNRETMALLQESFMRWTNDIRTGRCPPGEVSTVSGTCGDIEFYLMDVKFDQHKDPAEREYLGKLPTSFRLSDEAVDRLKKAARSILTESTDYQRLIRDLNKPDMNNPN
ncbi:MAG: hypothetical protein CSYNP_03089 [Syntrophus sp. SKADARSKE-3]|nr:hypothetical protein [Syntrophus sp. SKADARSKE-3]